MVLLAAELMNRTLSERHRDYRFFVWVLGDNKPYLEQLKALKFQWPSKKIVLFLMLEDYSKQSRKNYKLNEIHAMYGTSGAMNCSGTVKLDEATSAYRFNKYLYFVG